MGTSHRAIKRWVAVVGGVLFAIRAAASPHASARHRNPLAPVLPPPIAAMAQLATTTCFKAASGRAPPQPQRSVRRRRLATAAAMPQQPAQAELDCQPRSWARAAGGWAAGLGAACLLLAGSGSPAEAARLPPVEDTPGRCDISALDKFADTRATFSLEASGGNMVEAIVDIRGCDYRYAGGVHASLPPWCSAGFLQLPFAFHSVGT